MANQKWISDFGNLGVKTIATTRSDHYALLQNQPIPNVEAIKLLNKEIGMYLEQEDMKWKQRAKKD